MKTAQLNLLDELYLHLDRRDEPWVVHVEMRVDGRLDAERLAHALAGAVERHPIARARLGSWQPLDVGYSWDIIEHLSEVPFRIADCPDEAALEEARERLFDFSPPVEAAPPFAALLAHVPNGDGLILNINHAAIDGVGAMRLMLSILRAYAEEDDPVPSFDPLEVRDVLPLAAAESVAEQYQRARTLVRLAGGQITPPSRVARDGSTQQPGYGFEFVSLSAGETAALSDLRVPGTTINDVLLGALAVTVSRWNDLHGKNVGRIALTMPVNLRPDEWRHEVVSNFAAYATISMGSDARLDLAHAVAAAGERTAVIKRDGLAGAVVDVLKRLSVLSVAVKRRLPDLIPLTGDFVVDTASLSNLGVVDNPPASLGSAGSVRAIWFSQPGRMPLGTCVGALTFGGRLHVTLRYRHAQFDRAAARAFCRMFREVLRGDGTG